MRSYQICNRCIMDNSDPDIVFDSKGFCNHCTTALTRLEGWNISKEDKKKALEKFLLRMEHFNKT